MHIISIYFIRKELKHKPSTANTFQLLLISFTVFFGFGPNIAQVADLKNKNQLDDFVHLMKKKTKLEEEVREGRPNPFHNGKSEC